MGLLTGRCSGRVGVQAGGARWCEIYVVHAASWSMQKPYWHESFLLHCDAFGGWNGAAPIGKAWVEEGCEAYVLLSTHAVIV